MFRDVDPLVFRGVVLADEVVNVFARYELCLSQLYEVDVESFIKLCRPQHLVFVWCTWLRCIGQVALELELEVGCGDVSQVGGE